MKYRVLQFTLDGGEPIPVDIEIDVTEDEAASLDHGILPENFIVTRIVNSPSLRTSTLRAMVDET